MKISTAAREYLIEIEVRKFTPKTIRSYRNNLNLFLRYCETEAQILGTSQTMYARYERGANEMPIRHLISLCRLYNVSADFLLGTEPDKRRLAKKATL